jgi:hypothetical protein
MLIRDFGLALAIAFLPAVCFYPAIGWRPRARLRLFIVLEAIVLAAPWAIPAHAPILRLLAGVIAAMPAVKLWDVCRAGRQGSPATPVQYLLYLSNPFSIVWRKIIAERRPPIREDLLRVVFGILGSVGAAWVCFAVFVFQWRQFPFALEHCTKLPAVFLVILVLPNTLAAAYRLLGIPSTDFSNNFFLARTPAEFWRGYNRPAGQFLHEDVFKMLGGPRFPMTGALATFAVSGLIHEYFFDVAAGRVQGYQMAFFLVQGIASVATARLRPIGWRAAVWMLATFGFNLATGLLFFASMNDAIPFYVRRFR